MTRPPCGLRFPMRRGSIREYTEAVRGRYMRAKKVTPQAAAWSYQGSYNGACVDQARGFEKAMGEIPAKCRELRVAKWLPWWCRGVCTRAGTKLCHWLCRPLEKA